MHLNLWPRLTYAYYRMAKALGDKPTQEAARRWAEDIAEQNEGSNGDWFLGYPDENDMAALAVIVQAARCLNSRESRCAIKLLRLAIQLVERPVDFPEFSDGNDIPVADINRVVKKRLAEGDQYAHTKMGVSLYELIGSPAGSHIETV